MDIKKIISFSLWGNSQKYLIGATENLKLQKDIYPKWICRYYIDETVPQKIIEQLQTNGAEIIKKEKSNHYKGLFWRFEPGYDETIERFVVRDCDSRLNQREANAVMEWEKSGISFHCMRDHAYHGIPIMGAMWGAVPLFLPDYKQLLNNFLNKIDDQPIISRSRYFQTDQVFLNTILWPKISSFALVHDDMKRITGTEKTFTTILQDKQFVGQQWGENNQPLKIPI